MVIKMLKELTENFDKEKASMKNDIEAIKYSQK